MKHSYILYARLSYVHVLENAFLGNFAAGKLTAVNFLAGNAARKFHPAKFLPCVNFATRNFRRREVSPQGNFASRNFCRLEISP